MLVGVWSKRRKMESESIKGINERIKAMKDSGYTVKEIADALGISSRELEEFTTSQSLIENLKKIKDYIKSHLGGHISTVVGNDVVSITLREVDSKTQKAIFFQRKYSYAEVEKATDPTDIGDQFIAAHNNQKRK